MQSPEKTITPRPASRIAYVHMALPPFPASRVVGIGHDARAAGGDEAGHVALCVLDVEILRAVAVHGQRAGRVVGEVQLIAAPRQLHQLVAPACVAVIFSNRDTLTGEERPGMYYFSCF